jgi:hypothetical protein
MTRQTLVVVTILLLLQSTGALLAVKPIINLPSLARHPSSSSLLIKSRKRGGDQSPFNGSILRRRKASGGLTFVRGGAAYGSNNNNNDNDGGRRDGGRQYGEFASEARNEYIAKWNDERITKKGRVGEGVACCARWR